MNRPTCHNIQRMMEIIADPWQSNPEGQQYEAKLQERSQDFQNTEKKYQPINAEGVKIKISQLNF